MMPRSLHLFLAALAALAAPAQAADAPAGDAKNLDFFEQKIRPVLVAQCYKCHSATSEKLKGDLLVDSRAGLLRKIRDVLRRGRLTACARHIDDVQARRPHR